MEGHLRCAVKQRRISQGPNLSFAPSRWYLRDSVDSISARPWTYETEPQSWLFGAGLERTADSYLGFIDLLIQRLIDHLKDGPVDICAWYNFTTFDIIGMLFLGESFDNLENSKSHDWYRSSTFKDKLQS
jgi:hypothetical protein